MIKELQNQLANLTDVIRHLSTEIYAYPSTNLNGFSIGSHVRHITEFVQCLVEQYDSGKVDYDLRKRDQLIEVDPNFAINILLSLIKQLPKNDCSLQVMYRSYTNECYETNSTYFRELLYNVEHCIHHEALIKVALNEMEIHVSNHPNFGIATSTIRATLK